MPVREVEAELLGSDRRAGLAHMRAEPLPESGMEQMGRGVVSHRAMARVVVDPRLDARARLQAFRGQHQRLVVPGANH